jgi:uridylate kinase
MGMLATVINALALQDAFIRNGRKAKVLSTVEMNTFADFYTQRDADRYLSEGNVVIFGGGLGAPYFSTDTPAVVRAAEIGADVVLMAKNIDGLYNADPRKDPFAVRYDDVTYAEILEKDLKAFDLTAISFCNENGIDSFAALHGEEETLPDPQILDIIMFVINDLDAENKIFCNCEDHSGEYEVEVGNDGISVRCKKCGASAFIPTDSGLGAYDFLHSESLYLK